MPSRVALVTPRYVPHPGGVELHVSKLAEGLARRGWKAEVLAQEPDRDRLGVETGDVVVRRFPLAFRSERFPISPGLLSYLARHRHDYDVVHAHNYHSGAPLLAAMSGASPLVVTTHFHGGGHTPLARAAHVPYRLVASLMFRRVAALIGVSEAEAELVRDRLRFPGEVTVIPNGVDTAAFVDLEPFGDVGPTVVTVGRLEHYKNVEALIDAAAHLPRDVRVVIVGDGPARPQLEARVRARSLDDRVSFRGRVSDLEVRRWLRTAGTFVTLSRHEAFGLTVVEALAAGARVLASDIPAHRELLERYGGDVGTLVPLDIHPADLAAQLDPSADRGRDNGAGVPVPSWDEVAARVEAVYHGVVRASDPAVSELSASRADRY